jgi:hypothetical protein
MATAEQITVANKTSRHSPAVGAKALTPQTARIFLESRFPDRDADVLDFGAGKTAMHAQAFVKDGWNVLAHEFGDNIDPRVHCELAMLNKYDVVYASNVLNVQSDEAMLRETLRQVKSVMKEGAVFFANYPLSPRKSGMSVEEVHSIIEEEFIFAKEVAGKKNAPVWFIQ